MLALDFGQRKNGDPVDIDFRAGDFTTRLAGTVSILGDEFAGVLVNIGLDDAFWFALTRGQTLQFSVSGETMRSVPLRGAGAPVRRFVDKCRETFAATDTSTPAAPGAPETYRCVDGSAFQLTIDNSRSYSVATIVMNGRAATLVQVPSGSGVLYSNGTVEMHTKGDEALMISPKETVRCSRGG